MNQKASRILVSAALIACSVSAAFAADIMMVTPSAANVSLQGGNAVVRFNVSGTAGSQDHCGYFVEYGDGAAGDSRIIEKENGQFSRSHERTFTKPGTYTIKASGKNVKTTAGCNGAASATVTVVAASTRAERRSERRAAQAPVCPEGWNLNEQSVNRNTGAFSCAPKAPVQLVCPEGLRYYEQNGMIGCRQGRRG